eukprot:823641-Amphidinium_carterae.1
MSEGCNIQRPQNNQKMISRTARQSHNDSQERDHHPLEVTAALKMHSWFPARWPPKNLISTQSKVDQQSPRRVQKTGFYRRIG